MVETLVITFNGRIVYKEIDNDRRCQMCVMVSYHGLHRTHQTHTMTHVQGLHSGTYENTVYHVKHTSALLVEIITIPPLNFPPCLVLVKVVICIHLD